MPRKENELIVEKLSEKFGNNKGMVLTEYHGLTVAELCELRTKLRPLKCEYKVVKNTFSKIALKNKAFESLAAHFQGPTAVAIEKGDPIACAKVLMDFSKDHAKLKLKAGVLGDRILSVEDIKSLANLPSREVLIAKLLGTLQAPISNLVNVLQASIRNFVYVLDAVRKEKSKSSDK